MINNMAAAGNIHTVDIHEEDEEDENDGAKECSSSSETEEEVEPKLRYERLSGDIPEILKKDAASCVAVHPKFIALGTHSGKIHILDHQGNNIPGQQFHLNTAAVNHLSIDDSGDHLAACMNDGKVVIHSLFSLDYYYTVTVDRPVRAIALDPLFYVPSLGRKFIIGEDKVILYEKGLLSRYKSIVLYYGEGPVRNVTWRTHFVAWATDKSVRVYDTNSRETIALIQKDSSPQIRAELYCCKFFWKDDKTLLIGWADSVKLCVVKERFQDSLQSKPMPNHYLEITALFTTEFYISGIASLMDHVVTLTLSKNAESDSLVGSRPALCILDPHGDDYSLISSDILSLRGYENDRCNDYILDALTEDGHFFIITLKDFVVAKPRDEDDHVAWLLERNLYDQALQAVLESKNLKKHSLLEVGQIYLDHLLQQRQYCEAARKCSLILSNNRDLWEEMVCKFAQVRQLRALAPYLPVGEQKLEPVNYEMVLNEFLQYDPAGFLNLIQKWPSDLYNIVNVVTAVMDRISLDVTNVDLLQSLSVLYIYQKRYDKALAIYLKIGNKDQVFKLICDHNLFSTIHDKLDILMELNAKEATDMLLKNMDKVPIDMVVSKLKHKPELLYKYLSKVFQKDPTLGEEHHSLLVELYAEYEPNMLLSFLRSSNNYKLEHAKSICEQRNLHAEVVFLLGRMGNTKLALQQIITKLEDINGAIDFCKEHDEKDLWEDLINFSLAQPEFVTVLLENIGTYVDPIMLIQKIEDGLTIPRLRNSLVKILQDYNLQISLREGCKKILVSDCFSLLEKLNKLQRKGLIIDEDQVCQACHRKLLVNDVRHAGDIHLFYCRHGFHEDCIPSRGLEACTICSAQKTCPRSSLPMGT